MPATNKMIKAYPDKSVRKVSIQESGSYSYEIPDAPEQRERDALKVLWCMYLKIQDPTHKTD